MKVVCPQCQTENAEGNQFCSQCGAKLSDMDSTATFTIPVDSAEEEQIDLDKLSVDGPLLIVVKGIGVGQTFNLSSDKVLIGRDPDNDIFLDDVTVSRKHAEIKKDKDKFVLVDTGSLNGTYLNRDRVDKGYLGNKDEIQIGKFKMIFLEEPKVKNGS